MSELKQNNYLLPFQVGPYSFCAPANEVEAIIEMPKIRSVPLTRNSFEGVFDYRGKIARVINLKRKFGLEPRDQTKKGLIILTKLESGLTGFCVDEVTEIIPSLNLNEFKLSSESSITAFDGYVIINNKIILNTNFNQLLNTEDSVHRLTPSQKKVKAIEENTLAIEAINKKIPGKVIEKPEASKEYNKRNTGKTRSMLNLPASQAAENNKTKSILSAKNTRKIQKSDQQKFFQTSQKTNKSHENFQPENKNRPFNSSAHRSRPQPLPNIRIEQKQTSTQKNTSKPTKRMLIAGSLAILFLSFLTIFLLKPAKKNSLANPAMPATGNQMLRKRNINNMPGHAAFSVINPDNSISNQSPGPKAEYKSPKKQAGPSGEEKAKSRLKIKKIDNNFLTVETEGFKIIVEHQNEKNQSGKTLLPKELKKINKIYIVVKGDTLWHIARRYLGDPLLYPSLAELSKINNPDLIYPGDKIYFIKKR